MKLKIELFSDIPSFYNICGPEYFFTVFVQYEPGEQFYGNDNKSLTSVSRREWKGKHLKDFPAGSWKRHCGDVLVVFECLKKKKVFENENNN